MPDGYAITDAHFIQYIVNVSAANDHTVLAGPVPNGKIWTILSAVGFPSVNETQDYWFAIYKAGFTPFNVTFPSQIAFLAAEANGCPLVREGMELKLFPGEYLEFLRDAHTVGSTISIGVRYVESDMPLYEYIEPQLAKRMNKMRSEVVQRAAAAGGSGGGGGGTGRPPGGGGMPRPK